MAKDTKQKIIRTAFYLFLQNGYKGVSLKAIEKATQLSKGAIYHHFDSKYEIYLAALDVYFFNMLQTVDTEDGDLGFRQRVLLRFRLLAKLFSTIEQMGGGISFPIRRFFQYQLESEQDGEIRQKIMEAMTAYREAMITLVQGAIDLGEVKPELSAHVVAFQLMGMTEGLAIHHSTIEKDVEAFLMRSYHEIIEPYLDLICKEDVRSLV